MNLINLKKCWITIAAESSYPNGDKKLNLDEEGLELTTHKKKAKVWSCDQTRKTMTTLLRQRLSQNSAKAAIANNRALSTRALSIAELSGACSAAMKQRRHTRRASNCSTGFRVTSYFGCINTVSNPEYLQGQGPAVRSKGRRNRHNKKTNGPPWRSAQDDQRNEGIGVGGDGSKRGANMS